MFKWIAYEFTKCVWYKRNLFGNPCTIQTKIFIEEKEKNIFGYKICKNRIIVKFYANITGTNNIKFLII